MITNRITTTQKQWIAQKSAITDKKLRIALLINQSAINILINKLGRKV